MRPNKMIYVNENINTSNLLEKELSLFLIFGRDFFVVLREELMKNLSVEGRVNLIPGRWSLLIVY